MVFPAHWKDTMRYLLLIMLSLMSVTQSLAANSKYSVKDFVRYAEFRQAKISPTGEYIAVTQQVDRQVRLIVLRLSDLQKIGLIQGNPREQINNFFWANNERLVMQMSEVTNYRATPRTLGQIYSANYDGSNARVIFGIDSASQNIGTRRQPGKVAAGQIIDRLAGDTNHILVSSHPLSKGNKVRLIRPEVYKVNINSGRRTRGPRAPMNNGSFTTDQNGEIRLFTGISGGFDIASYRRTPDGEWQLLPDDYQDLMPFHFDESNQFVYVLLRSDFIDNYGLYKMDIDSLELTEIHQPEQVDLRPSDGIFDTNGLLVGIAERDSTFEYHYFDTDNGVVRWHEMLTRAFKDQLVRFTSFTDDGSAAIVLVGSDTNPGDFYFFDTESKRADYLFSRAEWLTPDDMATVKPISYRASDGLVIDGYVTRLKTTEGPGPMVVIPHGGPAARDFWTYYAEAQLLASRGYTVLQMNFRGSDGYGLKHRNAGNKKWGSRIQQDIAEGTGWAIDEGFADENRICIYGGSFGAYSALMNVILYPDLYRCAIGLAGMYDFETQRTRSDTAEFEMADGFFERVFGDDKQSAIDFSPVYHTSKIKVPVFIAHGGKDERTPIQHARKLRKGLRDDKVPFEWMEKRNEGHGFYVEQNRIDFYTALVDFVDVHTSTQNR